MWASFIVVLFALFGSSGALQASEASVQKYPETVAVLQLLYDSEVKAGYRYELYAKAAAQEGYDNIAHMLTAMAASEAVHAKSYLFILKSLDVEPPLVDTESIKPATTQANLKFATEVELSEIDKEYPRYLKRIKGEQHLEAIKMITYAWQAEEQHRELIKEIKGATGMFFSSLLDYFRTNPSHYYVNDVCGATVSEIPESSCPICHLDLLTYREIPRPTYAD